MRFTKNMQSNILAAAWLILVIGLLYGRTIGFEFTRTDDISLVTNRSEFITDISSISEAFKEPFFLSRRANEGFYRPLVTVSLILDAQINGTEPAVFHLTNIMTHAVVCILIFFFLTMLSFERKMSIAAATLFAMHPVNTSAVCWIPGRIDIMLCIFCLVSLMSFVHYTRERSYPALALHLAAFAAALLTKEGAVILPFACLAYNPWKMHADKQVLDLPLHAGWVAILIAWVSVWTSVVSGAASEAGSWISTAAGNMPVLLMQLGKTLFPCSLSVLAFKADTSWVPGAISLAALAAAAWMIRNNTARMRLFAFGILWFALHTATTLPVADYQILESRLYVPAVGLIICIMAATEGIRQKRLLACLCAGIMIVFSCQSFTYAGSFRNAATFTENAVRTAPSNPLAHLNRGTLLQRKGDLLNAARHYKKALDLNPEQPNIANNLGAIRMSMGDHIKAEAFFRREIDINPSSYTAYFNLARSLVLQKQYTDAAPALEAAIKLNDSDVKKHISQYAEFHRARGELEAAAWFKQFE